MFHGRFLKNEAMEEAMNVAVIGAGNMGRALARRLVAGGHVISLANANPEKAKAVAEECSHA